MKSLVYTQVAPTVAGMWWHLADLHSDPTIVRVFKDADGYWSVRYDSLHLSLDATWSDDALDVDLAGDGIDFLENWSHKAWFAGPIPVPKAPKTPDSVDLS